MWPISTEDDDLSKKLNTLVQDIENLYITEFGNIFCSASPFMNPKMVVSGAFAEPGVKFMRNPDETQNEIFSSDEDLKTLRDKTMNKYTS